MLDRQDSTVLIRTGLVQVSGYGGKRQDNGAEGKIDSRD